MTAFYGFLSNGHTAALVSPKGSIDWLAFPRFDSPAVCARILGTDDNGYFCVVPETGGDVSQKYLDNTNILTTRWESPNGRAVLHDFLAIGRPQLRRLIKTEVPMTVNFAPRFQYGMIRPSSNAVRAGAIFRNPLSREALIFVVNGVPRLSSDKISADVSIGQWHLPPGHYELVVEYIADDQNKLVEAADVIRQQALILEDDMEHDTINSSMTETIEFWHHRLNQLPLYQGLHSRAYLRSLLVLYGLTYTTNGAIIAAPTTSLPETIGETRQWDYRYAWVRDGSYAAEAILEAGDHVGSRRFLEFLLNCIDLQGKPFQSPFFHVDGTLIHGEHDLDWLPGFQGSIPCREGNGATRQLQLDIEGDFLWTVWRYYQRTQDKDFVGYYWPTLKVTIEWVNKNWHQKDASLWEFRNQDAYYTHSQVMCWVALNYGSRLAEIVHDSVAEKWRTTAEKIRQTIEHDGFNSKAGHYVQSYGGEAVDAALLVMPLYDYCSANDPRFVATVRKIEEVLVKDCWVYRYASDMLGAATHPFVLASFWLARIYIRQGRLAESQAILEGILNKRTVLGLLGEHADQKTSEPRGNFPQGFSHLGLVMTLLEFSQAVSTVESTVAR